MPNEEQLEEFNKLPQPIIVSSQVAGPAKSKRVIRHAARRAYAHANRDTIRQTRIRRFQYALIGLTCVAVLTGVSMGAYWFLRDVPKETWASVVPGMQSPEKLLIEYNNVCVEFKETCDLVDTEGSRDRAIPHIDMLTARLRGFPNRIEALGPITTSQFEAIETTLRTQVPQNLTLADETVRRMRAKRMLISGQFFQALQHYSEAMDEAAEAMTDAWSDTSIDLRDQ